MTDTTFAELQAPPGPRAANIAWAILIVATLYICYFSQLGTIGFVGPDEPRYAWIARAMAESGDWVTPRLYGQPWFEKPVLYYWGAALSFKLFGVSEAAARLPSAVSALFATLALAWLALRIYGAETARWLLLLLPTSVGMIGFSHAAATDMPFSGMLTVAMVCAAAVLRLIRSARTPVLQRTPLLPLILFGVFLGLAVLAKGPAAVVLSGGAIFFWALFTKRWRDAFRLLHPAAIIAFCATALPWYILCARRNPDFFRVFIIEHNFRRYLTPEFQHLQPFWYYLPVLLIALLPWTATLLWSAVVGARLVLRTRCTKDSTWLLICWAGFCVAFFSTSHSKLPGYLLPVFPPIGLLVARSYISLAGTRRRSFRSAHLAAAAVLILIFALSESQTRLSSHLNSGLAASAGVVVVLFALANLMLGIFADDAAGNGWRVVLAPASVLPILAALLLAHFLVPFFFIRDPSGRTIARELNERQIPANQVSVMGMKRDMQYSVSFYLREEIKTWNENTATGGYLLTSGKNCAPLVRARFSCEPISFDEDYATGRFLFRLIPAGSVAGVAGSGKAQ